MVNSNSRFPLLSFIAFWSLCWLHSLLRRAGDDSDSTECKQLPDDIVERGLHADEVNDPTLKRRALLVGICYKHDPHDSWEVLDVTHTDVECFRDLLITTYGYSPEDITILKDDPNLSDLFQPTRVNMLRELRRLVSGAAPGDKFTFLYSGHSDQQEVLMDPGEEDDVDEVIITSDFKRIVGDELNDILVQGLPVGCSLVAILDTYFSGTMLDLPHYHCNDLYVPWLSKNEHHTKSWHNVIVRGNALDFVGFPDKAFEWCPTSFVGMTAGQQLNDAPSGSPLRIITETDSISLVNQCMTTAEADRQEDRSRRCSSPISFLSPDRQCSSPVSMRCDGWCKYDFMPRATVLSLSACADPRHAWEGSRVSLTAVLCRFLEKHPDPSFRTLVSHVNFQLYEDSRVLHEYTLGQKKKASRGEEDSFDRELSYFQSPQLSSLSKVQMSDILCL